MSRKLKHIRLKTCHFLFLLLFFVMVTCTTSAAYNVDHSDEFEFTSLKTDFDNLPDIVDGSSAEEIIAKDRILILLESEDPEVKQAFLIMEEYGVPLDMFSYSIPEYNTQLEILLWITEKRNVSGHERLAVAIALDYGAVLAICEEDVKDELKEYVVDLYDFFVETESLVSWNIEEYPLESTFPLVWGADSISTAHFFEETGQYPEGTTYGEIKPNYYVYPDWTLTFHDKKLTQEDFDWYFVDITTLEEMRSFLLNDKFPSQNLSGSDFEYVTDSIDCMLAFSLEYHTDNSAAEIEYIEVDGKITHGCGLSNPDWHWEHFRDNNFIIGCCRDVACMDTFFLKSINIPSTKVSVNWKSFGHQIVVFYDHGNNSLWRIPPYQEDVLDRNIDGPELALSNYYPVVWSNWHDPLFFPPRSYELLPDLKDGFDITPENLHTFEVDDWNPWNNTESENGSKITATELQEAMHYWLNDLPVSTTGEKVTTIRLQYLIHCWLNV
jgi:hypothetical protein